MSDLNKLKLTQMFIKTLTNSVGQSVDMHLICEDPMISIGVPSGDNIAQQIVEGLKAYQQFNLGVPPFKHFGTDVAKKD